MRESRFVEVEGSNTGMSVEKLGIGPGVDGHGV